MSNAQPAAGRRVVVTGFGVISSIGTGRAGFLAGLREGRCGAAPISGWDTTGFAHSTAYEVPGLDPEKYLRRIEPGRFGRVGAQAAAAARMAVDDAGLDPASVRDEPGVVAVGTTCGESLDVDALAGVEVRDGLDRLPADLARRVHAGRLSVAVAVELGLPNVEAVTIPTVCAAGSYAVGHALDALRDGEADYAICGGADSVSRMAFAGFYRLRAWAPEKCSPFDLDRNGFMFGEGAGMLVLETLEHARRRGATIHAEVAGFALNCDAGHPTRPDRERVAQCMAGALHDASAGAGEVDVVFAHGTGTKLNDAMESAAVRDVFGDHPPPVTALKAMIGHTQGAAGSHACIAAILGMNHDFIPPTVNFTTPDPECPVDCVPNVARPARVRTAVVNSLGVGGNNAAVVLRHAEVAA
ncbi:beta-ketoacyl-[acyl-carrier-protein] synthase family protein [Actinomadura darangshiensis]|uniref:Beta-ketoacyl-[acyl-carrier-protein] synthase family protein n=1 Tax=Actinomadura darangshiensis TaxID=705336 RepID=A0A4R5BQY3_9ACTN|nr:beta-ketoacyl-[acyl-carrier-protein] synthase family protein [Actinomadura darangshiensis]TDD87650.1 beta-ketoacyl-[acyl-carrier-protein] synthase family protein [Actinomadura darangshiensis]